ncbi:hypothetical protein L2E82_43124 [Cichorium intybus]|uniref:Uncharacterized protein n=1 Tax=Cichorium intybus TaxID=13427 RepID=A0ACB8ZNL8_CICIN|nr:hypothetical protein L2E82_43124 [Cichorium intybus]
MQFFSATSAIIIGKIPDFFGGDAFAGLATLHLSYNYLEGGLPSLLSYYLLNSNSATRSDLKNPVKVQRTSSHEATLQSTGHKKRITFNDNCRI